MYVSVRLQADRGVCTGRLRPVYASARTHAWTHGWVGVDHITTALRPSSNEFNESLQRRSVKFAAHIDVRFSEDRKSTVLYLTLQLL